MLESNPSTTQLVNLVGSLADQIRAGLEYRVLELVIVGYRKMSNTGLFKAEWKENKFSAVLTGCIRKHCQEFSRASGQTWSVVREFYHDNEEVIEGEGDPDTMPRIDIVIQTWTADYEEIRFPFECKRIAENNTNLIRLYVEKGIIDRYLTEKDYSAGFPWGGMIGYILKGSPTAIVVKLNEQINRQRSSSAEHLNISKPIAQFEAVYTSKHQHPKQAHPLTITHLLLSFPESANQALQTI